MKRNLIRHMKKNQKPKLPLAYVDSKRFKKSLRAFTRKAAAFIRGYEEIREMGMDLIKRLAAYERAERGERGASKN